MLSEDRRDMTASGKVDHAQIRDFSTLISAIELAQQRTLPLHVRLLPLGHTDFGVYTIFPHCPFCQAAARVGRWQRHYPTELHTCHVCGTAFSPAETASAERMNYEPRSLRDTLGDEAFRRFAKEYLVAHGEFPEAADGIVVETEAAELKRLAKNRLDQELARRRSEYLETHVYAGLPSLPKPHDELFDDDDQTPGTGSTGWFDSHNFAEVLRRCEALGVKITMMTHHSSDGKKDRCEMKNISKPLVVLAGWTSEGCDEKFSAVCRVPDSLVPISA
jgi:hypothetical protein